MKKKDMVRKHYCLTTANGQFNTSNLLDIGLDRNFRFNIIILKLMNTDIDIFSFLNDVGISSSIFFFFFKKLKKNTTGLILGKIVYSWVSTVGSCRREFF